MSLRTRALWLTLGLGFLAASATAGELRPFQASFNLTWHGMGAGTSQLELQRLDEGRWSYRSHSTPRGLFRLAMPADLSSRSIFAVRNGLIVPELFTSDDGAQTDSKDQHLAFNWVAGRVTGTAERHPVDLPTQPGLLDTLSVQIALMQELLAGRTPQRFVLVDKTRIKEYEYRSEGTEQLSTVLGEHHTVIFRSSRPGADAGTWFWCAPELGYLPLKVERREGRKVQWSMTLQRLQMGDP
jgi:hypothetical protein